MFIVVKIPHRGTPDVFSIFDEDELIDIAHTVYEGTFYRCINISEALEQDPENEYFSDGVWKILETDGQIIEASFDPYGNNVEHFRLTDAPSELEVAYAILSNDMHSMQVLSIEEAQDWIQKYPAGYSGHQSAEVRRAIKNKLASLDFYLEH
tara:strand:+ start:1033 stop:1488 length:456 start_codon:yes stop_codon:yes gene_type:complete